MRVRRSIEVWALYSFHFENSKILKCLLSRPIADLTSLVASLLTGFEKN